VKDGEDGFSRLEAKLDTLIRLVALTVISDQQTLKEKATKLSRAGLAPREIATLTESTANAVSVALSTAKRDARA
jgi:hypothetical protein